MKKSDPEMVEIEKILQSLDRFYEEQADEEDSIFHEGKITCCGGIPIRNGKCPICAERW